ncbi:InlB B-repeat-containing protein [Treponema primitia]|uniref:InlB B-repeat-containing protein n=1 Tax=Treponema primitia TaxID=88058 RepID=UPI0039809B66
MLIILAAFLTGCPGNSPSDDTTAPVLSNGAVNNLSSANGTTATLSFSSNEAGTHFYVVMPSNIASPNAAAVKTPDSTAVAGSAAVSVGANTIAVTGLTAGAQYKAYIIVVDTAGNLSDVLTIGSFTPVVEGPSTFTVTFNSNGGSAVTAISGLSSGATIELPANPSKDDNIFAGWFTDTALQNAFDSSTPITGNLTLYAKWTPEGTNPLFTIWRIGTDDNPGTPEIELYVLMEFKSDGTGSSKTYDASGNQIGAADNFTYNLTATEITIGGFAINYSITNGGNTLTLDDSEYTKWSALWLGSSITITNQPVFVITEYAISDTLNASVVVLTGPGGSVTLAEGSITSGRFSITIPSPGENIFTLSELGSLVTVPAGMKGVMINGLNDKDHTDIEVVLAKDQNETTSFLYADTDGTVTGSVDGKSFNATVKAGWNRLIVDNSAKTIINGVKEDHQWVYVDS